MIIIILLSLTMAITERLGAASARTTYFWFRSELLGHVLPEVVDDGWPTNYSNILVTHRFFSRG